MAERKRMTLAQMADNLEYLAGRVCASAAQPGRALLFLDGADADDLRQTADAIRWLDQNGVKEFIKHHRAKR